MKVQLYYKIGNDIIPFDNVLEIEEYYVGWNDTEIKVFVKDKVLKLGVEEGKTLLENKPYIVTKDGDTLFKPTEYVVIDETIVFGI